MVTQLLQFYIFGARLAMENWFVSWFNSHYYHLLYKNRDDQEAARFISNLLSYLNLDRGSKVLDLACGKGRHSAQLRKAGYDVIGIDLSEESIASAIENYQSDGLEFFVHDMRELYWSRHFDLVANLFTSFGYFHNADDDQKTLSGVADALNSGGLFVMDFMNAVKVEANLVEYEEKTVEGVKFELNRVVEEGVIKKRIHLIDGDIELDFEEKVDALKLSMFHEYFQIAGLELIETFGNYDLDPFNESSSDRLIMVCKKP
jgi:SAM-dependent methyltransferase